MSSHHRSGGPPSLMDDVHDFDRNFHSHRFESDRGGRGRGGGMRGRGGVGGGRGRGDGNFGPRGGVRGGRGDFHQRDRFNNNFNRPNDDHHRSGGNNQSKMPSLLDPDQQQSRPYDRDNNNRHGRMPYSRGSAHDSSGDGPPPLLDFGNDKSGLPASINNNSLPSLLSVQLENSGMPPSDSDKPNDSHKDYQHGDHSSSRSDHHSSSHRDSDNRYRDRDRDSHRSNRGGYNRPSSYNRDRSRSPRDRDHDHDRHGGHSREDRPYGGDHRRGGRGGGRDNYGRGGGGRGDHHHHREGHQSRFGPSDNNQQSWQDRRGGGGRGGFGGSGRGGFQEHQREIGPHRPNEQLPSDNHPFNRDGRPNFDRSPSQNRPFQEGFPHGNFDPMSGGLPGHNRPNFNQGPLLNRPDFYPPNANNPPYQQHNPRTGGRPSRFSDRQDEYEDDRPLTKPNFSLLNANTTTTPLYINQPNNPTYSQPRPQMTSTFSSQQQQQPPSLAGLFPPGGPTHHQPPGQFGWSNPQGQQAPIGLNPLMNPSLSTNDQQNSNLPGGHPSGNNFYGNTNDFHRQQQQQPPSATNPYFSGVPPVLPQAGAKPPNVQPNPVAIPSQQMPPVGATASGTTANADAWQQYYQQYWQYVQQQQQQQQTGVQPPATSMTAPQPTFPQVQPGSATAPKQPSTAGSTTGNTQDAAMTQASTEAWTQYWIQCQAYMQQQQQLQQQTQTSAANSATIAAPSQLYPQTAGKQPQTSSNPNASNTAPQSSNWQTWFTTK